MFINLHSRYLNALFLIQFLKDKVNCYSIVDTVGISVPTGQIEEVSSPP
jgi:hypothetical protein